jgi:hypothetical protein
MSVALSLADLAISPVDQQLGALVTSDLATTLDGFSLCLVYGRRSRAAGGLDGPAAGTRGNVLVTGQGCSPKFASGHF